jgi:hypothetical protein
MKEVVVSEVEIEDKVVVVRAVAVTSTGDVVVEVSNNK